MTQDEIIEMVKQAKILEKGDEWVFDMSNAFELTTNQKQLEAFAKLVAEKEREACAELADYLPVTTDGYLLPKSYADAIRARGQA